MGDHNYNSESVSVQQDIFCSDCGKNITEKDNRTVANSNRLGYTV